MFVRQTRSGINLWQAEPWASWDVVHAFSDRHGGVSAPPYRSLSLGLHVGDDANLVLENRRRFARALGVDVRSLVAGEQVHGTRVEVVTSAHRGRGALARADALSGVDAMVTDVPGLVLFGLFADCVPVFIYDSRRRAVGLAHAGWQGTVGGIAGRTVQTLADAFGSRPSDCYAAVGPAIGPCCYEVGEDVADRFRDMDADSVVDGEGRPRVNLWEANTRQLQEAGIPREHISVARLCTRCLQETFFSHRGDGGSTGRMAAAIGV